MCKTYVVLRRMINDGPGSAGLMTGLDLGGSNLSYPMILHKEIRFDSLVCKDRYSSRK